MVVKFGNLERLQFFEDPVTNTIAYSTPLKPYIKVKNWEYMIVKPQYIYGRLHNTLSRKKCCQLKSKPYTLYYYKFNKNCIAK